MSGLVMGMLVMVMTRLRILPRMEWMPTAAMVPSTVASRLESTAMISELRSRRSRLPSRNSSAYCRRVKPSNVARSVPVLKLATTSTIIGI